MTFDLNFCGKIIWYKISIIMKKKRFELTVTNNTIFVYKIVYHFEIYEIFKISLKNQMLSNI